VIGWTIVVVWGYLVANGIREARAARRRRVCSVCGGRDLTEVSCLQWKGLGSGRRTVYRCDGCHEELISEGTDAPMTKAEYEAWAQTMHERFLATGFAEWEFPVAEARPRRWRRSRWWSR